MRPHWLCRAETAPKTSTGKVAEKRVAEICEAAIAADPETLERRVSF